MIVLQRKIQAVVKKRGLEKKCYSYNFLCTTIDMSSIDSDVNLHSKNFYSTLFPVQGL